MKASPGDTASAAEQQEQAMQMVPAQAALERTLESSKIQPGQQIQITLSKGVELKSGFALPRGTKLLGTANADKAQAGGASALTLRFTTAKLPGGSVLPVKATIVGVYGPVMGSGTGFSVTPGNQVQNTWNSQFVQVDQVDALNGVDLHSKIASDDSGTLVSTKKGNIKLSAGSEIALAIAVQKSS
jgi:hypothetical protein